MPAMVVMLGLFSVLTARASVAVTPVALGVVTPLK